jgi:hypothetical protein
MWICVESNFLVPGLEEADGVEIDLPVVTLRQFLNLLSAKAPTPLEYVKPGASAVDPYEWEVEINGSPYQQHEGCLDAVLKDGDTVTIRIVPIGGG